MLRINQTLVEQNYSAPDLFFTLAGNIKSEQVIVALRSVFGDDACRIFADPGEIKNVFLDGHSPDAAVVLFDGSLSGEFSPRSLMRSSDKNTIPRGRVEPYGPYRYRQK